MPDVSLYVAVITAGAAVVGTAIPQFTTLIRDSRQAERDRRGRYADTRRQVCLDLLRAAGTLRTEVANAAQYHGEGMRDRLAEIRKCAGAVQEHAAHIELLAPGPLAGPADRLAKTAGEFAAEAVANTDMRLNEMVRPPNTSDLDGVIEAFRVQAVAEADK